MKSIFVILCLFVGQVPAPTTNTCKASVKSEVGRVPLIGATIVLRGTRLTATTDSNGVFELTGIPNGPQTIEVSVPGYETSELSLIFPMPDQTEHLILLKKHADLGEVTITSTTRVSREIDDVPTRIEAIAEEEVDEKIDMRPANVSMVLNESTGIKVQQTSVTSNTQSIRIQGLEGRYTQILKDGFPAYGGFSGSLTLLDIPPLDLKQVEIIKGPSATFYGAGAIAGVVNFISKSPQPQRATTLILNQTSAGGSDFSLFDSQLHGRVGYTILGSASYQREFDVDDDDFTELPRTHSFNIHPRVFFNINQRTRVVFGDSASYQDRKGGDVFVIKGDGDNFHRYFESDRSLRNIATAQIERDLSHGRLVARQSLASFSRTIETSDHLFEGRQINSYSDVSYFHSLGRHALVAGLSGTYDAFRERRQRGAGLRRNETRGIAGGYVQDNFEITKRLSMEAGLRIDNLVGEGTFVLPRISTLYRFDENLTSRFSFGLGYAAPTIFTEQAEMLLFRNVLPLDKNLSAERSRGGTFDVNYRKRFGERFSWSINQMFFYTRIERPLVLDQAGSFFKFSSANRPIRSEGIETNLRIQLSSLTFFAGYTYTDAKARYRSGDQTLPLVPRNRINSALLFERPGNFKTGLEAYYSSAQTLSDGQSAPSFEVFGIFGEKTFGKITFFINAENINDTRQSRFGAVVLPPHQNPGFREIFTHLEGRVFNGGIKIKFQ